MADYCIGARMVLVGLLKSRLLANQLLYRCSCCGHFEVEFDKTSHRCNHFIIPKDPRIAQEEAEADEMPNMRK